tara:strand:+ start:8133 stop:10340 length:2208 start_codon:yes stop_codon:yes gene_type:complete
MTGRSSKVQRRFEAARKEEAERKKNIKIAESDVSLINTARAAIANPNNRRLVGRMRNGQLAFRHSNLRTNYEEWVTQDRWQSIANRDLQKAQQVYAKAAATPSKSITMEQANRMVKSSRSSQRGAALSKAKSAGKSMASISGSGLIQKAYADSQTTAVKKRISTAAATNRDNFFFTGSGPVTVSRGGSVVSPKSEEGQTLQAIYDRQKAQREINKEQKKLFDRVTGASSYKDAFNFQEKSASINPNVGTFQQTFKGGELMETRGVKGVGTGQVTITNKQGDAMAFFNPSVIRDETGKRVGSIDSVSVDSSFDFFKVKPNVSKPKSKIAEMQGPVQQSSFNFFSGLTEQKPKKEDPVKDFFSGMTDPFYNIGMTFAAVPEATKRIVTTGDFFAGQKYFEKDVQPKLKPTGFDRFFGVTPNITPAREAGTWAGDALAFFAPIPGSKAVKGIKMPNFFGSSKGTTKGTKGFTSDDFFYSKPDKYTIFDLDTAEPGMVSQRVRLGRGITQFFDMSKPTSGPSKTGPSDFFKAVGPKTKGGGTYKEYRSTDFWRGPETKTGLLTLQKTKVKTKQKPVVKNQLVDQFFKVQTKQKVKTKQKQLFKPVAKQKTKPMQFFKPITKQKQSPIPLLKTKPKVAQKVKPATSFFPSTKTAAKPRGSMKPPLILPWGFFGGGGSGSRSKRMRRGSKSYTGWNVNPDTVGAFFKGQEYKTTKTTSAFKYYEAKRKRSKSKKTFYDNFF